MGRILHLPAATVPLVELLKWGSVVTALAAMTGRAPRLTGWLVGIAWVWYQYVAFAYGKVDHDRGDFVVALLLLPTVGIAHLNDERRSQAAGFALRCIQISAISTYFLSSVAKIRFGGWGWVNSATLVRAVVRRGTPIGHWFLHVPWFLHTFQWVIVDRRAQLADHLLRQRAVAAAAGRARGTSSTSRSTRPSRSRSGRTW